MAFMRDGIKQIEVNELKEILKAKPKDVVVIDVREREEYDDFHIPGIPLIPMQTIPNILDDLKPDKEYIFVCRSGNRSHNVARFLKENGIDDAHNFSGGMLTWDDEVRTGLENVITDISKLYE
ncbi:rhodanese-like domain-containing protein [Anaerobacillus isosaccharinicus]|uniref:Rhodanese-like domain-containing protein n=1 Tax=Anaerobacillus isosaccharinicus TaxID=1532552 RepID=A0A7S7L472_9BACI|nr:rhodanese-like domain-containing protein [Anaerobacillus isosaccharinicus]MBA5587727.1 rhodanese-like domain-containing protein [Anaerobacillus isosaccharinicus]QOY34109.1 rhodanese-like domain-containing protein [Anaerobacillus isosaccharinicus]